MEANDWTFCDFGHICRHSAFGPRFSSDEYAPDGNIACLRTKDISVDGRIELSAMPLANLELTRLENHILQNEDLVITRTGRVGTTAVFTGFQLPVVPGAFLIRFRLDQKVASPWFFKYFFNSSTGQHLIQSIATGSVQQNLNITNLHRLRVPLPPLSEQQAIAEILGSLDAKIELNRRMNETLESLARSLFKSWFVDFDPVRAKLDGREPRGLSPAIAALFPDSFEHQNGELIPSGWSIDMLKDRAKKIQYGFTQSASSQCVGPHFLRITDIRGGRVDWNSVPFCEGDTEELAKYAIKDGDIFVARTGASTGDNIYIVAPPNAVFASYLVRFQFESRGIGRVVGEFMRTSDYFDHVAGSIGGSAQPNASAQTLAAAHAVFPTEDIANAFYTAIRPLDLRRAMNARESVNLAILRDTLLPKLLSGELRVAEAERIASDAKAALDQNNVASTSKNSALSVSPAFRLSTPPAVSIANPLPKLPITSASVPNVKVKAEAAASAPTQHITDFDTNDVMAAFRQSLRGGQSLVTREDLLKDVSGRLGFRRLGSTIRKALKGHLRAAVRRKIVGTDGPDYVYAETRTLADYTRDELIDFLAAVIRKGTTLTREEAIHAVASHLGFARVTKHIRAPLKSAINGAIRRGVLGYEGELLWRET